VKFHGKDPGNPEEYGDPNYEANNAPSTQQSFGRAIEFALSTNSSSNQPTFL
jgi:hypothetical protein